MPGMKNKNAFQIVVASTVGPYHKARGMGGQDCFAFLKNKNRVVAVVSDGAGSAKYGKIGAKCVCEKVCEILMKADFKNIRQSIVDAIDCARDALLVHRLNKTKNESGLMDFSATLVGAVYQRNSGIFFHIGDGAGVALLNDKNKNAVISEPENGIFASETFFYTMDDWKDSLRFTPFEKAQSLFLMTDGVTCFALKKNEKMLEQGFVFPINLFLTQEQNTKKAARALKNTLETPKACRLSADDKTLMWVRLK